MRMNWRLFWYAATRWFRVTDQMQSICSTLPTGSSIQYLPERPRDKCLFKDALCRFHAGFPRRGKHADCSEMAQKASCIGNYQMFSLRYICIYTNISMMKYDTKYEYQYQHICNSPCLLCQITVRQISICAGCNIKFLLVWSTISGRWIPFVRSR